MLMEFFVYLSYVSQLPRNTQLQDDIKKLLELETAEKENKYHDGI